LKEFGHGEKQVDLMRTILLLLLLTVIAFAVGPVEERLAGLKVGADGDGQVVRQFGPGHLISKPWGGERYYRNGDLYLFAAYATDMVLSEVTISRTPILPPGRKDPLAAMQCPKVTVALTTGKGIALGATEAEVEKLYGKPSSRADGWEYKFLQSRGGLPKFFRVWFKDGRAVKISVFMPAG